MDRSTRAIIFNQLEILKILDPGQKAEYEKNQNIVASGFSHFYGDVLGCVAEEVPSEEVQAETLEIFSMFRALHQAKQNGWIPTNEFRSSYKGFDGNNDPHSSFAHFILNDQGMYDELTDQNSHSMGTIQVYRRMLARWRSIPYDQRVLSAEAAEQIIDL